MGEMRDVYRVLVGNSKGKRPFGRPRSRWENNINIELQKVGCGGHGLDRAGSRKVQVAGICKCGNESSRSIK